MSHKVHPKAFTIRSMKDWMTRGFYQKKPAFSLEEDYQLKYFLTKKLPKGIAQGIEIERSSSLIKIIIKTSRPALIIGRGGKGVEDLKNECQEILKKVAQRSFFSRNNSQEIHKDIKIEILEIRNPWTSAELTSQWVAGQLEKKMPFRRVLKMAIRKSIEQKEIQGVKIEVSGRLNGVEISRREWLKEGRLPRQTIRADIKYGFSQAFCSYGVIGVKVWLYKGDQF